MRREDKALSDRCLTAHVDYYREAAQQSRIEEARQFEEMCQIIQAEAAGSAFRPSLSIRKHLHPAFTCLLTDLRAYEAHLAGESS